VSIRKRYSPDVILRNKATKNPKILRGVYLELVERLRMTNLRLLPELALSDST
jgi:hypothetical protein